jgi:MFS family permease
MLRALAPVSALLLSVAILLMGNGLQGTLLPVRAGIEAFSTFDIGILGSAYFLGFALGCLLGPYAVRRVGHIRAFTAMVSIASTTALLHVVVLNPAIWWVMRGLTGFCFATLYMIIESWINEKASNETRGFVFSVYTIINLTVITLGQMMLTLTDPGTFVLFAIASVMISIAAVPVALTTSEAPAPLVSVRLRVGYLFHISPVGFVGGFVVGLVNGAFWSLAPVFAQRSGLSITGIALFMSISVICGAVMQWPLGAWSDRWDRRKVILVTCVGAALAGVGMFALHGNWRWGMLAFGAGFGAFAFPLYALCAAHMNDHVKPGGFVEASSGLLLLYAVGAISGPVVASAAMNMAGTAALFAYTAAAHVLFIAYTLYRMARRAPVELDERTAFTESAVMAQAVSAIETGSHEALSEQSEAAQDPQLNPGEQRQQGDGDRKA